VSEISGEQQAEVVAADFSAAVLLLELFVDDMGLIPGSRLAKYSTSNTAPVAFSSDMREKPSDIGTCPEKWIEQAIQRWHASGELKRRAACSMVAGGIPSNVSYRLDSSHVR
jgi:hypothetical protein